jgi:hypothetical protein
MVTTDSSFTTVVEKCTSKNKHRQFFTFYLGYDSLPIEVPPMIRKGRGAYTESSPERRVGKKFKTNAYDFKKSGKAEHGNTTFISHLLPAITGAAMAPILAAVEQRPIAELRS